LAPLPAPVTIYLFYFHHPSDVECSTGFVVT
jgi:hypothetical protein